MEIEIRKDTIKLKTPLRYGIYFFDGELYKPAKIGSCEMVPLTVNELKEFKEENESLFRRRASDS